MRFQTMIGGALRAYDVTPHFDGEYDAVVAGMGTAGATAVLALAKRRMRVLGIDRSTGMGGQGGMGCVWDYYYGQRGGLQEEISRACDELMATRRYTTTQRPGLPEQSFPGLVRSYAAEQMALRAGAQLWYEAQIVGVYMEDERVVGVRVVGSEGAKSIACRVLIDGTAEADAAWLAGCEMLPGRLADGATQYYSLARSRLVEDAYTIGSWSTQAHIDCGNPEQLTDRILSIMCLPSESGGESPDNRTVYLSPMLGNREGRRIRGREVLALREFLAGRRTEEPLFYAHSTIDSFNRDLALEDEEIQDFRSLCELGNVRLSVGVPMGALLPCRVRGMLVIGRCLSVDHDLSACVRMMRDMQKSGEAAAEMVFESVSSGIELEELPYEPLRQRLTASGCLDEAQDLPWIEGCRWSHQERDGQPILWPKNAREMRALLAQPFASGALWVCRQQQEAWRDKLLQWLTEEDGALQKHCAIALGLGRHPAALPVLREMARAGRGEEARKAVCLLGRYALREDVALMTGILSGPLIEVGAGAQDAEADQSALMFLQAEAALIRILRAHTGQEEARAWLVRRVFAPDFRLSITTGSLDLTAVAREMLCGTA